MRDGLSAEDASIETNAPRAMNGEAAASAPAAMEEERHRRERIASALRWGETLWISKQRLIKGTIAAFHDTKAVDGDQLPLFMVPSLPQLATDYADLAAMLAPRQPFFTVYLPSQWRDAESAGSVDALASYYAGVINSHQPTGPIAVGGWSAGATIALAVARLLEAIHREVRLLAIIDGAPPRVDIEPLGWIEHIRLTWYRAAHFCTNLAALARAMATCLCRWSLRDDSMDNVLRSCWQGSAFKHMWQRAIIAIQTRIRIKAWIGSRHPDDAPERHPAETASNIAGFPPSHRAFAMALYDSIESYRIDGTYRGNVLLFESTAEPARTSERFARKWAKIAPNLEVVPIRGSHMSIVKSPDGLALARHLCRRLDELSGADASRVSAMEDGSGQTTGGEATCARTPRLDLSGQPSASWAS